MEEMRGTEERTEERTARIQPKWWMGVLWFAVVMVVVAFAFGPIQYALGMPGLVVTELILLAMAVVPAVVMKWNIKEVFSLRLPKLRQVFGALIIWVGAFLLMMCVNMTIMYLFPQRMASTSTSMGNFFASINPVIAFLIIAVSPAICEEALCRGLIQHTFRDVKSKVIVVVAMGVIFGVFHMDPVRILGTGLLGAAIAYVLVETKSIVLPMLIHFTNNALSAAASLSTSGEQITEEAMNASLELISGSTMFLGVYFLLGAMAPVILLLGAALIREKKQTDTGVTAVVATPERNVVADEDVSEEQVNKPAPVKRPEGFITIKKILAAFICSAVIAVTGFGLIVYGVVSGGSNLNTYELYEMLGMEEEIKNSDSFSYFDVTDHYTVTGNVNNTYEVGVSDDGEFVLHIAVEGGNEDCRCGVKLLDENGTVVYDAGIGADWTLTTVEPLALKKGDYIVVFEYRCTDGVEVNEKFACRVKLTR